MLRTENESQQKTYDWKADKKSQGTFKQFSTAQYIAKAHQ